MKSNLSAAPLYEQFDFARRLPVPVICIDSGGCVAGWNLEAEVLLGWSSEYALGMEVSLLLEAHDRPRWETLRRLLRRRAEDSPILRDLHLRIRNRQGRSITFAVTANAMIIAESFFITAVAREITDTLQKPSLPAAVGEKLHGSYEAPAERLGYVDSSDWVRSVNPAEEYYFLQKLGQMVTRSHEETPDCGEQADAASIVSSMQVQSEQPKDLARQGDLCELDSTVYYRPDIGTDGTVRGFFTMASDMAARSITEQKLVASERGLRTLMDNLPVLVSYHDQHMRTLICNARHRDWLGFDPDELVGKSILQSLELTQSLHQAHHFERALLGEEVSFEGELQRDGVAHHYRTTVLPDRQSDGSVVGFFSLTVDQTNQKQVEQQLAQLARIDSLTGLPNRRHLEETLRRAVERTRRSGSSLVLMFVDVDHFKAINDGHGHAAGDCVLQTVARRLREQIRITDTVSRLAGDEFIVLLEDLVRAEDADPIADKILAAIAAPILLVGGSVHVTISMGMATAQGQHSDATQLMSAADAALYEAKRNGRNGVRWASGHAHR